MRNNNGECTKRKTLLTGATASIVSEDNGFFSSFSSGMVVPFGVGVGVGCWIRLGPGLTRTDRSDV
jgi:hypothetical protein